MLNLLQGFVLLLSTIISFFLQGSIVMLLFSKKLNVKRLLLFALVNSLAREIPLFTTSQYFLVINLVVYCILMVLTLYFILGLNIYKSLISVCLLFLVSSLVESGNLLIFKISFQEKFNALDWANSVKYSILMRNTCNFLLLIICVIIYYFKLTIHLSDDVSKRRYAAFAANSMIAVILIIPNLLFFTKATVKVPGELLLFNGISIFVLLSISIVNSIRFGELETIRQEIEFQKLYTQTLNDVIDSLRGFKHDYNNIVNVIGGYLALDDLDGLKKYYRQIQGECHTINNILPLNAQVNSNPALYGLLLSKISYTEMKDINFTLNLTCSFEQINLKTYDLCKILGILLDNAIEAAQDSNKKYVELLIKKNPTNPGTIIEISNSFSVDVNLDDIYKNGFTTKEGHSGFGLWEVKKILSRYKNCSLKTCYSGVLFTQQLYINAVK